jgi:hypothetical protein
MLRVRALTDGAKNATVEVVVRGDKPVSTTDLNWTTVVDLAQLKAAPRRARIDEIYYAVSDKVEVQIAWHHPSGERHELMPLGGRGRFAWPDVSPSAPDGEHSGNIEIRTIGLQPGQLVYLLFDMTKQ